MDRIFHMMAETATAMADKDDEALLRLHAEGIEMLYHSKAPGVSELVAILVEAMALIEEISNPAPDSKQPPPPNSVPLPAPEFVAVMPCGAFAMVGSVRTGPDITPRLLAAKSIADATVATMGRWEQAIANQLDKSDPVQPVAFLPARREQVVTLLADPTRNRPEPRTPTEGDDELW